MRRSERNKDAPFRFAGNESKLAPRKINVLPCEAGNISESLASIEPKENQAAPFVICDAQKALNLADRERSLVSRTVVFGRFCRTNAAGNIRCNEAGSLRVL